MVVVGHRQTALRHHLRQIPEAELEAETPIHTQHDDLAIKVTALEQFLQTQELVIVMPSAHRNPEDRGGGELHQSRMKRERVLPAQSARLRIGKAMIVIRTVQNLGDDHTTHPNGRSRSQHLAGSLGPTLVAQTAWRDAATLRLIPAARCNRSLAAPAGRV